ncbi:MAG: hypothetical protein HY331_03395 [Chloroflexi bacterium]|nr:hypothetical protein [Chloroflexota bacterium]
MGPTDVFTFHGTPRERGRQHGEALRAHVHEFYAALVEDICRRPQAPIAESAVVSYAAKHIPPTRDYAPDLYDEIGGIAEGADLRLDRVFVLNCFDELGALRVPALAERLLGQAPAGLTPADTGCTTFGFYGQATRDGQVCLGQTYDIQHWYQPHSFTLRIPGDAERPEAIAFTHAGVIGCVGINADGITVLQNSLKPLDTRPGAPYPVVVRKALQQRHLGNAIAAIAGAPRATGANYVLGSPETVVNLETSATRFSFTYVVDEIWGHSNHYLEPEMLDCEARRAAGSASTLLRNGRIRHLVRRHAGTLDRAAGRAFLSDHLNAPDSICRHTVVSASSPRGDGKTIAAMVAVPAERVMEISDGNPCEGRWAAIAAGEPAANLVANTATMTP